MRARLVGGLPGDLVGSLTGLTQGRFPLDGKARYAEDSGDSTLLFAQPGTNAVSTHDGKIVARGSNARLGRYVKVRDAFGNTYTYGRLSELEASYPVPKRNAKPKPNAHSHGPAADHPDEKVVEPRAGAPVVDRRRQGAPVRQPGPARRPSRRAATGRSAPPSPRAAPSTPTSC